MSNFPTRNEDGKPDFRKFENNGCWYGLPLGALVAVLIAGPHFYEWSSLRILGIIAGCSIGGGILGYISIAIAYGSETSGYGHVSSIGDDGSIGHISMGHAHAEGGGNGDAGSSDGGGAGDGGCGGDY